MNNLYWLDQIESGQRSWVGNKVLYLSHLSQKGLPVVPGFVVPTQVFRRFLESIHWLEPLFADLPYSSLRLNIENSRQLQAIAQQIRHTIEAAPLAEDLLPDLEAAAAQLNSPALILRPSLVIQPQPHSSISGWHPDANLKSSTLFTSQVCRSTEADIIKGLKSLWAQVFAAKSLFYWQRAGIPLQQVNLAVLVQPIWSAVVSGTVEVEGDFSEVQTTNGLGMAIAWGEVLPDRHQVNLKTGAIQTQHLGTRTIAYHISTRPATLSSLANSLGDDRALISPSPEASLEQNLIPLDHSLSQNSPLLRSYLLPEEHQRQYALKPDHLNELIQLVQQVAAEMGSLLSIEWAYVEDGLHPHLYLTQVTPNGQHGRAARLHTLSASSAEETRTHAAPAVAKSTGVLTGLAAAPGRTIARAYVIPQSEPFPTSIPPGMVLVAASIPPVRLSVIRQSAAIVTEHGGMTSHSAILAREIGVPAVMAVTDAIHQIQPGELLMVDGTRGQIYHIAEPTPWAETDQPLQAEAGEKGVSTGTQLMVSLSQRESLEQITDLPIDGVGLLRAELLMLTTDQPHSHWLRTERRSEFVALLADHIQQFTAAVYPRPVFYRSLDLRDYEYAEYALLSESKAIPAELNPTLGLRGTFRYVLNPALFDLELAALSQVQQSGYDNLRLLLPFVRTVEEFCFCRDRVQQAGLFNQSEFQLWIMAEVPSILFLLPEYVRAGVQGISIGTNDLTQLLLGIDRDHPQLSLAFNTLHPVVTAAIEQIIQQSRQAGIPCSICGQAPAQYPELVDHLVRWGITSISVEPNAVERTHQAIIRAEQHLLETVDQPQEG